MMAKKSLKGMIPKEAQKAVTSEVLDQQATDSQSPKLTKSVTPKVPKYLTLIRKEARLREDQIDELTTLMRRLNRSRNGGERITENTLIRVAVDLLLSRADELGGDTEDKLRNSVSL